KLDLAVVGADQQMAGFGDEGLADLTTLLRPYRDVLQVGIVGGQPPRGGRGQGIGGVHPAGALRDRLRQIVGIGALQLESRRQSMSTRGRAWPWAASSSRMRTSVPQAPVAVFFAPGRPISPNSTSPICFGEPRLNGRPTMRCASASRSAMRMEKSWLSSRSCSGSILIPSHSIWASTAGNGRSRVS